MCFAQGVMWTLILNGWRHWNREAKFSGQGVGARIRRWWWGVNKWTLPTERKSRLSDRKMARNVSEVSAAFLNVGSPIYHFGRLHADSWDSTIRASSRVRRRIRKSVEYCIKSFLVSPYHMCAGGLSEKKNATASLEYGSDDAVCVWTRFNGGGRNETGGPFPRQFQESFSVNHTPLSFR
jgi:hypothetical protein